MSSLLKAGFVSLLVASGGLAPAAESGLLCAADFSEFDELEETATAPQGGNVKKTTGQAASPNIGSEQVQSQQQPADSAGVDGADAGSMEEAADGEDAADDEFSAASQRTSSRSRSGKKKKRAAPGQQQQQQQQQQQAASQEKGRAADSEKIGGAAGDQAGEEEPVSYTVEYVAASAVAAYILNFFLGKSANEKKATSIANRYASLFRDNFYQVGPLSGEELDIVADEGKYCGMLLTKYSQSEFKVYATGNDYCPGMYADLVLQPRQELFSVLRSMLDPADDVLRLDIAFENEMAEKFVLAVLPAKKMTSALAEYLDLETYGKQVKKNHPRALSDSMVVLSDCLEAVRSLLSPELCAALSKSEAVFRRLHYSDQMSASTSTNAPLSKRRLVLEITLPPTEKKMESHGVDALVRAFFSLTDSVARLRLSAAGREKLAARRRKILEGKMKLDHASREEQTQQRLDEKAAREKETYSKLTPAQKRKWAEKEEKKRLKKEKKRAMMRSQMKIKMR